jgi:hypothetical protein
MYLRNPAAGFTGAPEPPEPPDATVRGTSEDH